MNIHSKILLIAVKEKSELWIFEGEDNNVKSRIIPASIGASVKEGVYASANVFTTFTLAKWVEISDVKNVISIIADKRVGVNEIGISNLDFEKFFNTLTDYKNHQISFSMMVLQFDPTRGYFPNNQGLRVDLYRIYDYLMRTKSIPSITYTKQQNIYQVTR